MASRSRRLVESELANDRRSQQKEVAKAPRIVDMVPAWRNATKSRFRLRTKLKTPSRDKTSNPRTQRRKRLPKEAERRYGQASYRT